MTLFTVKNHYWYFPNSKSVSGDLESSIRKSKNNVLDFTEGLPEITTDLDR